MRHGFKAQAERISAAARTELGISPLDPLPAWQYARHLGVTILPIESLALEADHLHQLLVVDPESWSGMTLKEAGRFCIVVNSAHSQGRQSSTLMHELAHIVLRHLPSRVDLSPTGLLLLGDYSDDQEDEADWLSAALLLPRQALVRARARGASVTDIAAAYGTSEQLCEWRLRMTGVDLQLRRARR